MVQAIASRLWGLPALVTPHCTFISSLSISFLDVDPSSYTQLGPSPGMSLSVTTRDCGFTVFRTADGDGLGPRPAGSGDGCLRSKVRRHRKQGLGGDKLDL